MHYQAYMLRLWISVESDTVKWRASLENVNTHERLVFAELDGLIAFLKDMARPENDDAPPSSHGKAV